MKRKSTNRSSAVYDFDEGDAEPFNAKRKKFFDLFSKGKGCSRDRGKNDGNKCEEPAQIPIKRMCCGKVNTKGTNANLSLSVKDIIWCKNDKNKCKVLTKRPTKSMCCEKVTARETNAVLPLSGSDTIETDDSDSESNQARRQLDMRFGGALGVSNAGVFKDEDFTAEESRKFVIYGEELWFLDEKYSSPEFSFTADAIEFKTKAFGAFRLPLLEIKALRTGSHEKGLFVIELDLTEHGTQSLEQHLGHPDNYNSCHTILRALLENGSCADTIKQITSLSDGYKSIYRHGKECVRHHPASSVNSIHKDRDNYESRENEHVLNDCIMHRDRASFSDWSDLIYPTEEDRDAVTVTRYDYLLLDPDQFLSDTIIDFYIKYLQSQIPEADKKRFYFYNSFFFRKLTEVDKNLKNGLEKSKSSFERVKRWTAGIDIFDKNYLFIPIMQNAHWSLVIICHPGYLSAGCSDASDFKAPVILHLDSLEGCHTFIEEPIRSYLMEAWRERNYHNEDSESLSTLQFVSLKVPQQTNYSDCGLFLLHYVELFIQEVLAKGSSKLFASCEWFNPADASRKRAHIQSLIQDLKANKSAGDHVRPQHLTDTNVMSSSNIPPRCDVSGVNRTRDILHGNLLDQDFSMLVSHHQHHENVMQFSACTRLGHDHVELGYVEVSGESPNFWHSPEHASYDELGTSSLLRQAAAVNHEQAILMPCCTCVEDNHIVQSKDFVSLEDSLECATYDHHVEDFHSRASQANKPLDEFTAKLVHGSVKSNVVEESFASAISDSFVNSSVDAEFGVAFSCHYDDKRIFDRQSSSVRKFSLNSMLSQQVFHECCTSNGGRAEEAGQSLEAAIAGIKAGAKAVDQESKDGLFGSVRDAFVWTKGKEALKIDFIDVSTQHSADDSYQEVGTDRVCMEEAKVRPVDEVAAAKTSSEGIFLQKKDGTLEAITLESFARLRSTGCLVSIESSASDEAGSDQPHYLSSRRGVTSTAGKGIADRKSERASPKRNKQCKLVPRVRRVTRSVSKGQ